VCCHWKNFSKVVQVNLIGTFNILRLAAAEMAQREPMLTVNGALSSNTASIAAYEGQVGQAAYSASKGRRCCLNSWPGLRRELAREGNSG